MTRLLSYYGDDFTGSTDVMEALATHGIDTVLFTRLPGPAEFAPFASLGEMFRPHEIATHLEEQIVRGDYGG